MGAVPATPPPEMSTSLNPYAMTKIRAAALHLRSGRNTPLESPADSSLSRLLRSSGHLVEEIDTPVLFSPVPLRQARVVIGSLAVVWRHPDPSVVVVSRIERLGGMSLRPSLRGFLSFIRYCALSDPGIEGVLGGVDPRLGGDISGDRLGLFLTRTVSMVETISVGSLLWYVGDPRDPRRHP